MTHQMVVGTTEPQDFALFDDDVAMAGTGFDIGIDWRGSDPAGTIVVAWLIQGDGTVRVTGIGDMAVGHYYFRWTLTDGASAVGYNPNKHDAHVWKVIPL